LGHAEFSSVVGGICDRAFDPGRWPNAIGRICEATSSFAEVIGVSDVATGGA
jgi:hypothetical protein